MIKDIKVGVTTYKGLERKFDGEGNELKNTSERLEAGIGFTFSEDEPVAKVFLAVLELLQRIKASQEVKKT